MDTGVDVEGAAVIPARHDGGEADLAVGVGDLRGAKPLLSGRVFAVGGRGGGRVATDDVGMPEVDGGANDLCADVVGDAVDVDGEGERDAVEDSGAVDRDGRRAGNGSSSHVGAGGVVADGLGKRAFSGGRNEDNSGSINDTTIETTGCIAQR